MSKGVKTPWVRLACALSALTIVACGGKDDPPIASSMTGPDVPPTTGTVGSAVTTVPVVTVKDQKGKALPNVWVKWTASAGKTVNDSSKTDAAGLATSGGWTLGTTAGSQTLIAAANGLGSVVFTVAAAPGPVRALTSVGGTVTGPVGSDVTPAPGVRATDQYGNNVAGVSVTFAVATGAGSITGATQTTNASGVATVGSWKLGTLAGTQTLRADAVQSGSFTTITATATPAAASEIVIIEPGQSTGSTGKRLCTSPVVAVRDAFGNGIGGVTVTFTPAANSGTVVGGGVVTSAASTGFATVRSWTLGASGTQTLTASSAAIPGKTLTFTATLVPAASFTICPRFIGTGGTPRQREAITKAAARWQQVIVGHTQTTPIRVPAGDCVGGIPALDEDVEDLVLYVSLASIDGPGAVIGQAGPCYIHLPIGLTAIGYMEFDIADLDLMLTQGLLDNTALHELGHILGIGSLWNFRRSLLVGSVASGGTDPYFTGAAAREQYGLLPNPYVGTPVPVENCVGIPGCGAGTRDGHWRKSVFNTELMQGYVNRDMPLSRITVGSLADLGYTVNMAAADNYAFITALNADASAEPRGLQLMNDMADLPIWGIAKNGTRTLVRTSANPFKR